MGGVRLKGCGSVEDGEVLLAALLPLTKPAPAVDPDDPTCETERDPRDHGARMWDALIQTAQHGLDTEFPPESHGARPRVAVTTTLDALQTGLGSSRGQTETGLELSVATVRRLACDADVIPGVLDSDGMVLDVGRAQPTGHRRDLDRPDPARPALRLPRLHPATRRCATPTTSSTGPTAAPPR